MTRILNLVILVLVTNLICANEIKIQGTVTNDSNKVLQYVSIGIVNKTIGTVSDKNGSFTLIINKDQISDNDTLRFSMIGYSAKSFSILEIKNKSNLNIQLSEKIKKIPEAIVIGKKIKTKIKGTTHYHLPLVVMLTDTTKQNQNLGSAIARSFNISHENTTIERIKFFACSNYDTTTIRINFYSIKKRKPHKSILNEGIYVQTNGTYHDWISIDLKKYNIVVSDDIIIGIEWVGKSKEGDYLFFPLARPSLASHYYKWGSQNKWERWPHMSCLMELTLKY